MLRVLFVTQDDPFYVPIFFREFISILDDQEIEISGVVIQTPLGKKSNLRLVREMWDFYGAIDFLKLGWKYAFFKVLNYIAVVLCKGRFPGTFSLKHLLMKKGWNIINTRNVNSEEFLNNIQSGQVSLIVSVAASQIFKSPLLSAPRYGCINIHNSRLPKNRGMLPNFWALYHYDAEPLSAMTVHKMNDELDGGQIILQEEFSLDPTQSLDQLIRKTKQMNAHLVLRAIQLFHHGEPTTMPNDASLATYNTFPKKADVDKFKAKGLKLL